MLWPHFTIAMQCVEHPQQAPCQPLQRPPEAQALPPALSLIGFASRHPPFTRYAYIDVLQGRIPSGAFRNKHVLIGSNATGVATTAATPGAPEQAMMSNVELLAHTLHSQLQPHALHPASTSSNVALNLALVGAGLLAVLLLSPSSALVACAALAVLALGITWASASLWGSVLQPMAWPRPTRCGVGGGKQRRWGFFKPNCVPCNSKAARCCLASPGGGAISCSSTSCKFSTPCSTCSTCKPSASRPCALSRTTFGHRSAPC